jgi:GT2 family glycosyltransferase
MLDIVVQIVNYKTKRYLSDCLQSIIEGQRDSDINYKISVLENGSGEDLSDIEETYASEPVTFHYSDENLGFGAGQNLLAGTETSRYLLSLNPDTVVSPTALGRLFELMETDGEVGLCGPRVEEDLGLMWFWWHKKTFWPARFTVKNFCEKYLKIDVARESTAIEYSPLLGSALFFRRKAFDEVGGFDENLFLYFEEMDICNSLKMCNWKVIFVYDAVITHLCPKSEAQPENAIIFQESKEYFQRKWQLRGDIPVLNDRDEKELTGSRR